MVIIIIAVLASMMFSPNNFPAVQVNASDLAVSQVWIEGIYEKTELNTTSFALRRIFPVRAPVSSANELGAFTIALEKNAAWNGTIEVWNVTSFDPLIFNQLLYNTTKPLSLKIRNDGFGVFVHINRSALVNTNSGDEVDLQINEPNNPTLINNITRAWISFPPGSTTIIFDLIRSNSLTIVETAQPTFDLNGDALRVVIRAKSITPLRLHTEGRFSITSSKWDTLKVDTWSYPVNVKLFFPRGSIHYGPNSLDLRGGQDVRLLDFEGNIQFLTSKDPNLSYQGRTKNLLVGEKSVLEWDWLTSLMVVTLSISPTNVIEGVIVGVVLVIIGIGGSILRKKLRQPGPSISLVDNDEKLLLRPEVNSYLQLSRLPFDIQLTLANNGGMSAIVDQPKVMFVPEDNVKDDGLNVDIDEYYWSPPTSQDTLPYPSIDSIPPKTIKTLMLTCSLRLFYWDYRPPNEYFSQGSNLRRIHEDYFNAKKRDLQQLISKIEPSGKIGILRVSLMTSITLSGNLKMDEKTFGDGLELLIDSQYLGKIIEKMDDWNFEVTNAANSYLNFLGVVEQQGQGILDTLHRRPSDASHISFPDEHRQDMTYARETMCIAYPDFAALWNNLLAHKTIYPAILTSLREQKRGRTLDDKDERDILGLEEALKKVLDKCSEIRVTILTDFRP